MMKETIAEEAVRAEESAEKKAEIALSENAPDSKPDKGKKSKKSFWSKNKIEIITAIFLGVTALLTAWATWIGSLHSGIQATNFTKSTNISSEAGTVYDYELQVYISDAMTWNKIVDYSFEMVLAEADGNQKKADLLKEKLQTYKQQNASEILLEGLDWMVANDADSPFEMPGITEKYFGEAKGMFQEAHDLLTEGQNDNARGDAYNLVTVLFSIVLFLLGVVGVFKRLPNRVVILSIAVVILAGAAIYMLTIPLPTGFNLWKYIGLH